ncbi:amino acid adenylation domain-containing protein [Streptomyces sp. NBC_01264]|uniref:amino acid adenylation domain-containing protein n=1 Tax=Streptomyces sp. NBC_01264 TaxID=2903804 RepID=UPI0022548901|nr:amino acid adenylation domain-containing protein [Streptomyces sp. NBC_01264]MCX4775400.1 amino acid adenylation domain-containing protein [Streptomyces sp. NBC_01264]
MSPTETTPVPLRIAHRAGITPEATAVRAAEGELTYRQLDRRARAVAEELRATGAGPEDTVLLGVRRGIHWAVGLLGIWYAGAAALLVDLDAPDERLRTLLDAAGTRHAVAPDTYAAAMLQRRTGCELFWAATTTASATTTAPTITAAATAAEPPACIAPGSLAYVLFTSGSTGLPKPVAVGHAGLAAQVRTLAERYGLTAGDAVLQFAAPAFDVSLEEALPTWCTGGTAVFVTDNVLAPAELEPFLAEQRISVVNLPTPYWTQWAKDLERAPRALPGALRRVVIGSDAGRTADLVNWAAAGHPPVVSCYGLTESTITAISYEPGAAELAGFAGDELIPLGEPLAGVRAYVLDEELREAPPGTPGELYLAGSCLARGYHGRPALTSERFVADPFAGAPGARMYRTGDRVTRAPGGPLVFLGRADDQVKIRGHRVELKEVEAAVAAHPDVVDVVARAVAAAGGPQLAAWAALTPGSALTPDALRRHLLARMPGYLVPTTVTLMERLPRTPGGKLDPRALPAPALR